MVRLMNPRLCLLWGGGAVLVLLLLLATRPKEDEVEGFGDPVKGAARALHQAAAALLPPPPGVSPPLLQVSALAQALLPAAIGKAIGFFVFRFACVSDQGCHI